MKKIDRNIILSAVLLCVLIAYALFLTSCSSIIDFRDKAIALETKVVGLEITVPDITGGTGSLLSLRLGWVSTKYSSAPVGAEVTIDDQYNDINFWTMSGTVKSLITVKNNKQKYPVDAPLK